MVGFTEAALSRLENLVAKSKTGTFTVTEALELRELKLLKQTAAISKSRANLAVAKRKNENLEKYRVGGFAVALGLSQWSDDELRGAFAMLTELSATVRAELAMKGRQATAPVESVFVPFRVSFAESPGETTLTELKKRGFKWNQTAVAWDGVGDPVEAQAQVKNVGGTVSLLPRESTV